VTWCRTRAGHLTQCPPFVWQAKDFHLSLQACGVLVEGPTSHPFDEDSPKVSREPRVMVTVARQCFALTLQGFLRCEGLGSLVLKRSSDAVSSGDRVLCEVTAGG
jgi:hypothetical protein